MKLKEDGATKRFQTTIHYQNTEDHPSIATAIRKLIPKSSVAQIVVVCIGTDRSTGDSLGPLVGMHLQDHGLNNAAVYGTLDNPVHAVNLEETITTIHTVYDSPFIIAIDACLGKLSNVGNICVASGPVLPGAGVNKKLTPVGDMNITGIVNVSGYMEYSVLQNTRLGIVMKLSQVISQSLLLALTSHVIEPPIIRYGS
ncbi:spore protease YyaC [Sporolactobacillus spathodeae]|uniref:Sporulation protein YyaC n=1 Tax=Sporolactobacillus spathodeae TaxID=1465502 RepID=A0ABS2Q649_9BACL|nr:spore protease YyaC [Sporolactobacillus spathodeae]MBM7656795.1 putative sporulation protein YyaC [Sporolactobacillus spathodeae]